MSASGIIAWLERNWVAGAVFILISEALILPVLAGAFATPVLLIYLAGPAYRLHQIEEHTGDRFRAYINEAVLSGREGLKPFDVLVINLPGVWGLNAVALCAAWFTQDAAWGLCAIWLMAINALSHVMMAIARREANPGVYTSIFVFAPLCALAIWSVEASVAQQALGLAISLVIHAAIVINVVRRVRAEG